MTTPDLMSAAKKLLQNLGGQKYHVRRGVINWTSFSWNTFPFACALAMPEVDDGNGGMFTSGTMTVVFMTRMPDHAQLDIDDGVIDAMRQDALLFASQLEAMVDPDDSNSSGIMSVTKLPTLELADVDKLLQGVSASFLLEY